MSTAYPWQGLPEQAFQLKRVDGNEAYFKPQSQLMQMLQQGNPVYLVLGMPCGLTTVHLTFPAQGVVRVYRDRVHKSALLAEAGEESWPHRLLPSRVRYRFGMRLSPWLFGAYLPSEHARLLNEDVIINYPVLSSGTGHSGVLIRIARTPSTYEQYWMELYAFSTGNEHCFDRGWRADRQTKLIARFRPGGDGLNAGKLWAPEMLPSLVV